MPNTNKRIYSLDSISRTKIKSAVQITCLNQIILELVKNALDAHASNIKVTLNYSRGFCSVIDNGHGIAAQEFEEDGRLAQPYCSSKYNQAEQTYGRYGRHLAAIAGVAVLAIESRDDDSEHASVLWYDATGRLGHAKASSDFPGRDTGTQVKVYNLFSSLPVRKQHLAERFDSLYEVQAEFDRLKHSLVSLILASTLPFGIDVQHLSSLCRYLHRPTSPLAQASIVPVATPPLGSVISILREAGFAGNSSQSCWESCTIKSDGINIRAAISLEPAPHKLTQFVSLNHEPLTGETGYGLLQFMNRLFEVSNFDASANEQCMPTQHTTNTHASPRHSRHAINKGVDRWPMFVLWIESDHWWIDDLEFFGIRVHERHEFLHLLETLIQSMVNEFLTTHDLLRPRDSTLSSTRRTTASTRSIETSDRFRYWSRIKSSSGAIGNDILKGLPFRGATGQEHKHATQSPTRTLSSRNNAPTNRAGDEKGGAAALSELNEEPGTISWIDPRTGCRLRIDSRTGMVMPARTEAAETSSTITSSSRPISTLAENRNKNLQSRSLAHVIKSLPHLGGSVNHPEQPIRSLSLFSEVGESLAPRTQSYQERVDTYWHHVGNSRLVHSQFDTPRVSKRALDCATIIGQVDKKFVLIMVGDVTDCQLVLVDQHAADERCKVENLLQSVHTADTVTLDKPLIFEVTFREAQGLLGLKQRFAAWGIDYHILLTAQSHSNPDPIQSEAGTRLVHVNGLPAVIAERCRGTPKLVINMLREVLWSEDWKRGAAWPTNTKPAAEVPSTETYTETTNRNLSMFVLPSKLLDLVNSRACRSAIMFNDELSRKQCTVLIEQLRMCTLPFQCAHGRPSMVVLTDLTSLPSHESLATTNMSSNLARLGRGKHIQRPTPGRLDAQTSFLPPNLHTQTGLNTVDLDSTPTFGQAYRAWIRDA